MAKKQKLNSMRILEQNNIAYEAIEYPSDIKNAEEVVKMGDEVLVKVVDIDRQGRIKLSRKEAFGEKPASKE